MIPAALQTLADRLGAAVEVEPRHLGRNVTAALAAALDAGDWLPVERRRASHANYARHLLYADSAGRYCILAIVWEQGQASPIHGHHTWCAVGVYQGEITECFYREQPGFAPAMTGSTRRGAGTLSFDPAAGAVHRIANEGRNRAISLHVYGTGASRITTGVNRILG